MARYPEKALQLRATLRLAQDRGYVEHFSDEEGRGARMDSAGLIDGRLVLIEVKHRIGASLLAAASAEAGPIEAKIAAALTGLYRAHPDPLSTVAGAIWDRRRPPLVALLAEHWSPKARGDLAVLCRRRADEWGFDWAFWRWTGERVETIDEGSTSLPPPVDAAAWAALPIPGLRATAKRAPNRTIDDLRAIAAERGVADLFETFLAEAGAAGHRTKPARASLTVQVRGQPGYATTAAVYAAYLDASTPGRLAVGVWSERLAAAPGDLPGAASPHPFGFLGDDRFLSEPDEVTRLFALPLRASG
ncbi:hypothetical protein [Pinisolibacter aquiterrae]|uniref:hypothetical protein n=1 Tax=Pinisolibacter aquiterrae TaxID=2815579 RepID=UPI001C3E0024|nr:hypothetical protein [Pinisolibacter aquiterrae]MBV5263346.1 hypothetical protein [Pinisolibacter aquiterrae]MCC8237576.1 hypothetical protein [Pinisolibacter aquiterrae]